MSIATTMNVLHNDAICRKKWKILFEENRFATPFQSPEYYDFFNGVHGCSAEVMAVTNNEDLQALCVITIQKERSAAAYFSRRAIIYGGPLIGDGLNGKIALDILLKAINQKMARKVIYIETRNHNDYSPFKSIFSSSGWLYAPRLNVQLHLKNKEIGDIYRDMKANRRKQIRLSYENGAMVREAESRKEVFELYKILQTLYKERVKLPLPGFDFFYGLFLSSVGKVFIVHHGNIIIGGSFCLYYYNNTINTLYYCGLRDYHKKIFPAHLALMGAIEFGLNHHLKTADLMGAGTPSQEYGVRKYKTRFGGELVEHGRFFQIYNNLLYNIGKLGLHLYQKVWR